MIETTLIDGKAAAAHWRDETATRVAAAVHRRGDGSCPGLKVILLGDHPASRAYVSTKTRVAAELGIDAELIALPETTTTDALLDQIAALNADPATHGILVQLPLPAGVDESRVLDAIAPEKDVDGFHPVNVGRLHSGAPLDRLLAPCTPLGCLRLLQQTLGDLKGRNAVVIGRSNIVGKPMAAMLLAVDCTVTIAHSKTIGIEAVCQSADILVAAIGRPRMVPAGWIQKGACVIDVGINRLAPEPGESRGRLVGDVDFDAALGVAGAITPVPGGVGPMTVAGLMRNTLVAYESADPLNR